jgi:two-component system NtrC family sensor kinase
MSPSSIVLSIVIAIATLGTIAYWDDAREARAGLNDFADEQAKLASGLAAALQARASLRVAPVVLGAEALRSAFAPFAEPETVALLRGPGQDAFLSMTGEAAPLEELGASSGTCWLADGRRSGCWRRIAREESIRLGLPARTAIAGISGFTDPDGGAWRVVVVTSAQRERDREKRSQWRLLLGFLLSSGLVLAFGTFALRKQKTELALARELAVREAVRARDERLVRADKLATMGARATGIAHEVSTPLGVIVGRAEQLAPRVAGDERARRAVASIAEQADRIGSVVRAFLTLARGGAPSLERVDPARLVRVAVELVQHRFEEAGVTLRLTADEDLPKVACDTRLLEQALVNLLLNACDACTAGGAVQVVVRRAADMVAFLVIDDGAGITPEAALRATEPFFTTKPEGKGTGLGLAITNEIVLHHQGRLAIAAASSGRGTEARIELPMTDAERR